MVLVFPCRCREYPRLKLRSKTIPCDFQCGGGIGCDIFEESYDKGIKRESEGIGDFDGFCLQVERDTEGGGGGVGFWHGREVWV